MAKRETSTRRSSLAATPTASPSKPLAGKVALVAGATRGAGRGIARALGEAGATVYCTGRSVTGKPSPYKRPETIDQTVEMITAQGGDAIAIRVDHAVEAEVAALVTRIESRTWPARRAGGQRRRRGSDPGAVGLVLEDRPDTRGRGVPADDRVAHHHREARGGADDRAGSRRDRRGDREQHSRRGRESSESIAKLALKGLALNMAAELRAHGVAAMAITPGTCARNRCSSTTA